METSLPGAQEIPLLIQCIFVFSWWEKGKQEPTLEQMDTEGILHIYFYK